jgi:hypothetical protein
MSNSIFRGNNIVNILKRRYVGMYIEDFSGRQTRIVDIYTFHGNYFFQVERNQKYDGTSYTYWGIICKELRIYMNITFSVTGRTLRDIEILFNGETY